MSIWKSDLMPIIIVKEILDQRREFEDILSNYDAKEPEEIERWIQRGELKEHLAYEDFLSALALRRNIEEMKESFL